MQAFYFIFLVFLKLLRKVFFICLLNVAIAQWFILARTAELFSDIKQKRPYKKDPLFTLPTNGC